jgi:hypothetical protein
MTIRSRSRAAAIAVLLALFAFAGTAAADGLQRFHELLPRIPKGELAYESVSGLGPSGFVLDNVVIRERGRRSVTPTDLRVRRLTVEEIDFDRLWTDEAPHFARLRMEGVTAPGLSAFFKKHGIAEQPAEFRLDYRFDPPTRVLTISRLEASAPGLSHLSLEMTLGNLRSLAVADQAQWLNTVTLRSLKLVYEDRSALRRGVRAYAEQERKPEAALVRDWQQALAVLAVGKGARTTAAADALVSFLQDYRKPSGRLQVSIHPSKPLGLPLLMGAILSADPGQQLGLDVSYPGTRPGAAAAVGKH